MKKILLRRDAPAGFTKSRPHDRTRLHSIYDCTATCVVE